MLFSFEYSRGAACVKVYSESFKVDFGSCFAPTINSIAFKFILQVHPSCPSFEFILNPLPDFLKVITRKTALCHYSATLQT
jgi:hypothetical protein